MLKAVKPEIIKASKPKMLISGKSGVGKTRFALEFIRPYLFDIEGGAVRDQYRKQLIASGGSYFGKEEGSQDFKAVIEETKALATTKHDYRTAIFDSFSKLYNLEAAIAEATVGNDYGKDKKEANKPTRQLMRWIDKLDLSVILICHQRDKWERRGKEIIHAGTTFDGYDKLEYDLDLWIEIHKEGKNRVFIVKKSRIESFIEGNEYPLEFKLFAEMYGKDVIESASTPLKLVDAEAAAEIERLISVMKIEPDQVQAWLKKEDAETFADFSEDRAKKLLDALNKKLQGGK